MVIFTGIMTLMIIFCVISFIHAHIAKAQNEKYRELLEQPITAEVIRKRLFTIKSGMLSWLISIIAMAQFLSILILIALFISTVPEHMSPLIAVLAICIFTIFSLSLFSNSIVDSIQASYAYKVYADKVSQHCSEQKSESRSSDINQKPFHIWLSDITKQ